MDKPRKSSLRVTHTWHKCNEHDCFICNGGLGSCTVCNGAEVQLPRDCPGVPMTEEQKLAVQNDQLDFYKGRWWRSDVEDDLGLKEVEQRVDIWLRDCVGDDVAENLDERNHRFCEEALELLQACGYKLKDVMSMAAHVFEKEPSTDIAGECADVLFVFFPLIKARDIDLGTAFRTALDRNWANSDKIREKNRHKPIRAGKLR